MKIYCKFLTNFPYILILKAAHARVEKSITSLTIIKQKVKRKEANASSMNFNTKEF